MSKTTNVSTINDVVIRFAGDSGDGMQLSGSIFSDVAAILGNQISTFPNYPAEIRAPHGSLAGVSSFQVRIGTEGVYTPGDYADVLVAMNPSALKVNVKAIKNNATIIYDSSTFDASGLKKGEYTSEDPFLELGLTNNTIIPVAITEMARESLKEFDMDLKSVDRCRNMLALGVVLWLYNKDISPAEELLKKKFGKKPTILQANIKVLTDGYNYGHNTHASATTYHIEGRDQRPGHYTEITGNEATALGLVAAAEKSGRQLFLGSYPITPATDILHTLAKFKALGVKTVQAEDEIAGITTAIGASYAGALGVTSTSGPGLALKSEALGYAVITELPLLLIDVMRGGPSTGLPTKSEQTDLMQALYGRNGESPLVVMAATTPTDCFDTAFEAAQIALEHMTPVILLTDAYLGNGASAWRIPDLSTYPEIKPPYVESNYQGEKPWKPYFRDPESYVRYWAIPGVEGFTHRVGGLEKDCETGVISTDPRNHARMVGYRKEKIARIAHRLPQQEIIGDEDAELLVIGWGSTYGHILSAVEEIRAAGRKIAMTHFKYINPLPSNTTELIKRFEKVVVVEQNLGQFAAYLSGQISGLDPYKFNKVEGQPLKVREIADYLLHILDGKDVKQGGL
ncbi:MAG: 2-oxoacid:acceptor oxidoreductase subunit alpha [Porphyromonas somerae]|uniref:2-oxoacid:acceptor oxidoreductase subunit alpha n=1 Tax=Porphyromonas somerae TaxID=322095 RepID=UPI0026ED0A1E|nr:2-oxoacid:acceptor oxidoreductase subunit alpha [Porphyromonas somerae]MDD7557846.1 2-oxoacid:acceptor oxidoreductase subunit alpha [Porphyromonas somerae]MDY5815645.1 2-oxoacid:acceptor oxidoreductase subunit alpha [Porphyromonas somerae]